MDVSPVTSPTVGSILTDVALDTCHDSVAERPAVMVLGFAPNELITGGPGVVAATAADSAEVFPAGSVAETAYEYVVAGVSPAS